MTVLGMMDVFDNVPALPKGIVLTVLYVVLTVLHVVLTVLYVVLTVLHVVLIVSYVSATSRGSARSRGRRAHRT